MNDLIEFLRARYDEIEQLACAAQHPDAPVGGERWHWVYSNSHSPRLVDQPVEIDADEVFLGDSRDEFGVRLESREKPDIGWSGTPLPHFVIPRAEEVPVGVGQHIVRHSPAHVLRDIAAKRAILAQYESLSDAPPGTPGIDIVRAELGTVLLALSLQFADRPDYREEWKP